MSEYDKIEAELVALGWTVNQGKGDHVKFTKSGFRRPITVSRTISGRSYQNTISNIRQIEPTFSLGKNMKSKEEMLRQQQLDETKAMSEDQLRQLRYYSYIAPGAVVRYTSPEQRDYGKLNDEHSVMNIRYVVKELNTLSGKTSVISDDDQVVICEDGGENTEITVKATDLEQWETRVCPSCGKRLPLNRFFDFMEKFPEEVSDICCDTCFHDAEIAVSSFKNSSLAQSDNNPLNKSADDVCGFSAELSAELDKYPNIPIHMLPVTLQKRVIDETKENMKRIEKELGAKKAQRTIDEMEHMLEWAGVEVNEVRPMSKFESWKRYLKGLALILEQRLHNAEKKDVDRMKKTLLASSYSMDKVGSLPVLSIYVQNDVVAYLFVQGLSRLYDTFDSFYEDKRYCVRLRCPAIGFDQFLSCPGEHRGLMAALRENLSEKDFETKCVGSRIFTELPSCEDMKDVGNRELQRLVELGVITQEESTSVTVTTGFAPMQYASASIEDPAAVLEDSFYMTPNISFVVNDVAVPGLYERIRGSEECKRLLENIRKEEKMAETDVEIAPLLQYNDSRKDEFLLEPRKVHEHRVAKKMVLDIPYEDWCELKMMADDADGSVEDVILDIITSFVRSSEVLEDEADTKEEPDVYENDNPKNIDKMTDYTCLDLANPVAEKEELRDITTREMLRELKARGVMFDNLTVPVVVRQGVSLDEI